MLRSAMQLEKPDYSYVLFIDEAGDDGLKRVKPIDPDGATEWLVIGGVLVRSENETRTVDWVKDLREQINQFQGPVLHYRNLTPQKRRSACQIMATKPLVCFAVCSNKKNMRQYNNPRAAMRGGKQWFYNYCVRLLMERATEVCLSDGLKRHGAPRNLKVVFSERGSHSYGQTKAYWEVLKRQAAAKTTFLNKRTMRHEVLRYQLVDYVPHTQNAGLQLADVVASAFYQACDSRGNRWDTSPAKFLLPQMYREEGVVADCGLVLQPTPPKQAELTFEQQDIFKFYGYRF